MTIKDLTMDDLAYTKRKWQAGSIEREEWRLEGALHSVNDEPAVVVDGGEELQWYKMGLRHRDEIFGPAWVKGKTGIFTYYNLDLIHRMNGPAMVGNHSMKWYTHGKITRGDGPAVIMHDGVTTDAGLTHEWWYNGSRCNNFDRWAEVSYCDSELYVMLKLQYS